MRTNVNDTYILDLNRRFHDEVEAETYDTRMGTQHNATACTRMIQELEHVLGAQLPKGGRVADAAAGTGNIAIKLAQTKWYNQVIAVDISSKSLAVARQNARALDSCVITLPSDMRVLPFEDNSMDMLVGCAFLHHLPRPDQFMEEVYRVLKPGAPFIIIGEPTNFGAHAIHIMKWPLVMMNRFLQSFKKHNGNTSAWDHDNIDVHDFTRKDADALLKNFEKKRIVTQGFLEPIIDQGFITPVRHVLGKHIFFDFLFTNTTKLCRFIDQYSFNYILPKFMRVSLKISAYKPI